jgi:hypothetical protein
MKKEFKNRKQWRGWLQRQHDNESEVWLVLYKENHRKTAFGLEESNEEA